MSDAQTIYDFTVKDIKGNEVSLEKYKGHVCLIVNVASKCGLTKSNYAALNELFDKYGESKGLRILGMYLVIIIILYLLIIKVIICPYFTGLSFFSLPLVLYCNCPVF